MNIKTVLFAAAFAASAAFISCDESKPTSSNLAGAWEFVCDTKSENPVNNMEFFNDGTGIVNIKANRKDASVAFKWQFRDGNRLQITSTVGGVEVSEIYDAELSEKGTLLALRDKDNNKEVYSRKGAKKEENAEIVSSTFSDKRDGKNYKSVKIGEQTWMAENLNFEADGSKCYGNDPANCAKYGRLYNWETAMKACPAGWHLPTDAEWDKLYRYADGTYPCVDGNSKNYYNSETAGKFLKAASGWKNNGNGTDKFGFAALPGGGYGLSGGSFISAGDDGHWWSASEYDASSAYYRYMDYYRERAIWWNGGKSLLLSVRCLQD